MKKLVTVLVLAIGFTLTTQAQKERKNSLDKLTVVQQTELAVKKMTLKLDLTPSQQRDITPLLAEKITKRKAMDRKKKAMKDRDKKGKELSANERFLMNSKILDAQITFKAEMKRVLNKQQYERFEKMNERKSHRTEKKMKRKKGLKKEHRQHLEK